MILGSMTYVGSARAALIEELRLQVERAAGSRPHRSMPFDVQALDGRLADGGLSTAALHEITASAPTLAEDAAATLFIAGVAARMGDPGSPALWAVTRFDLYSPGLEQVGLGPDRVIFVEAGDDKDVLAVMEDALRHGSPAAVVGEVRRADMTATRRLQLAAAEGGTPALLMRKWRKAGSCPLAEPSAATTRWRIGCAPAAALGVPGVGRARWNVELVRQRNGPPFSLVLEGCDAQGRLALPAAAAHRAAASGGTAARAA